VTVQPALFDIEPKYCIDTNVIVSFLHQADDEFYGADVFAPQWALFERLIANGEIIAPDAVKTELNKWALKNPVIHDWLRDRAGMFRGPTTGQLAKAKEIVNRLPGYGRDLHYLGDLMVVSLAAVEHLTVITLESVDGSAPSRMRPKIPFTCAEFEVDCTTVAGFLRREHPRSAADR
jgi:hypothetical protein